MRNFDSIYHFAENGWTAEAQSHSDPVFTPLFISMGVTGAFQIGAYTITYASVAAAIAAGGEFWEFTP